MYILLLRIAYLTKGKSKIFSRNNYLNIRNEIDSYKLISEIPFGLYDKAID